MQWRLLCRIETWMANGEVKQLKWMEKYLRTKIWLNEQCNQNIYYINHSANDQASN